MGLLSDVIVATFGMTFWPWWLLMIPVAVHISSELTKCRAGAYDKSVGRVRVTCDSARRRGNPDLGQRGAHFAFRIATGRTHLRHGADCPTGRCRA